LEKRNNMIDKRIVFLGTPKMSAFVLEGLVKAGFNIVGVITREDKPQGRKMELKASPVGEKAAELGLKVFKPHKLNKEYQFLDELKPDLLLTFAYGQIISETVLAYGNYKPLNLHGSLLPKYRGAAPIQYALKNGESETGVSLMEMVKAMDAGDVFAVEKIAITSDDNYSSLCDKMQVTALDVATKYLPLYFENKLTGVKQDESLVTFCPSIKKEEEHLDLNLSPLAFTNEVRSLSEVPGGYLMWEDQILKIYKTSVFDEKEDYPLGKIVKAQKKEIILQVKGGKVSIQLLQKPGKKMMGAADFNNGTHNFEGIILK
jgi:methionyl-tRNA formyltransferase